MKYRCNLLTVLVFRDIILFNRMVIIVLSYNKLWKLLIDLNMKKKDLKDLTGIGSTTLTKLNRNEPVSMDVIIKICLALKCNVGDIMDVVA